MTQRTSSTKEHVPRDRAQRAVAIGGAALLAVFIALAAWSLQETPEPADPADLRPPGPTPKKTEPTPTNPQTNPKPSLTPPPLPEPKPDLIKLLKVPREMSKLLAQRFQFTRHDGAPAFAHLRSALGPERTVTVLNVWAPYCEPCKREFPAFRRLQAGWGDQVRFFPIQLGEGDPGELAGVMPTAPHHLIDFVPGGAVQSTLAELELLPTSAPIPITLVLDCRNQLRWLSAQEITDVAAFDGVITDLRRELDTPACTRAPTPSIQTTPQETPHCGNGRCEPLPHREDCLSCAADCRCKPGQLCASQTGGARDKLGHVCMDELQ